MDLAYFKNYIDQYIAGPSAIDPELTAENYYKPGLHLPALSANATLNKVLKFTTNPNNTNNVGNGNGDNSSIVLDLSFPSQVGARLGGRLVGWKHV